MISVAGLNKCRGIDRQAVPELSPAPDLVGGRAVGVAALPAQAAAPPAAADPPAASNGGIEFVTAVHLKDSICK